MEEKLSAADQERQKRWQKELEIIERDERQHKERDRSRVQRHNATPQELDLMHEAMNRKRRENG